MVGDRKNPMEKLLSKGFSSVTRLQQKIDEKIDFFYSQHFTNEFSIKIKYDRKPYFRI